MSDFQQWKKANGDDFSIWDYLSGVTNVEVALAFTTLFWPDLVEHDGGIFLAEAFNQEIYEQWKAGARHFKNSCLTAMLLSPCPYCNQPHFYR